MERSCLDNIIIVLVEPQDSGNIGSVCRAMKTMGITELRIVSKTEYDENRIKTLALHAFNIWENRKTFNELKDALSDCNLTVGTSRRHGKFRKTRFFTPKELASELEKKYCRKTAIVFGCESSGLTDEQLRECQCLVSIPTSDFFPSLNLSHAVQIICYELYQTLKKYPDTEKTVTIKRAEEVSNICLDALDGINYFKVSSERNFTGDFLRDIIGRAGLTEGEVQRFQKIFTKTSAILNHKQ